MEEGVPESTHREHRTRWTAGRSKVRQQVPPQAIRARRGLSQRVSETPHKRIAMPRALHAAACAACGVPMTLAEGRHDTRRQRAQA